MDDETIDIDGTNYTRKQVDRQTRRIYAVVFQDGEYEDGDAAYGGKLNSELIQIINDTIVTDEPIEEDRLNVMIAEIVTGFRSWIKDNTKSVHPVIIEAFLTDFVPACLEQFFRIEETASPNVGLGNYDPAYG